MVKLTYIGELYKILVDRIGNEEKYEEKYS